MKLKFFCIIQLGTQNSNQKGAKNVEKAKRTKAVKKNTGILLDVGLWKRFRIACIEADTHPGAVVDKLIRGYLAQERRGKRSK